MQKDKSVFASMAMLTDTAKKQVQQIKQQTRSNMNFRRDLVMDTSHALTPESFNTNLKKNHTGDTTAATGFLQVKGTRAKMQTQLTHLFNFKHIFTHVP